jgi:tetratricopeptide (TPR) repeat protein
MGALEAEKAYSRALELCQQVGETSWLFPVLQGLWQCSVERGEIQTAHALGERYLRMAQNVQDPSLLLKGHNELGTVLFHCGELLAARAHLEQAIALYDRQLPRYHPLLGSVTAHTVHCLLYLAFVLWLLGYPDQALKKSREALALAQEESFPFIQAWTLCFAAQVHWLRQELSAAKERVEASITLSTNHGFEEFRAVGMGLRGCVLVAEGLVEEGIAQMHQGMTVRQATGTTIGWPNVLAQLARAYGKAGRPEAGLSLLDEALATADNTGQRMSEAVLYTFKGELLLQSKSQGPKSQLQQSSETGGRSLELEAEECFWQAIAIAHQQQAKSLELRATMSLSRLWQRQGKREEARQRLAEIYGWFTEGFDTADLKEAKVLLKEFN